MKKRFIFLVVFLMLLGSAALSPLLLNQQTIQKRINRQLTIFFGEQAAISELNWRWLPIPALQIRNLVSENDLYSLKVSQVLLFPNWRSIFNQSFSLGMVKFLHPKLTIKRLSRHPNFSWASKIPNIRLSIKDGELSLPAVNLAGGINLNTLELNNLQLDVTSHNKRLKVNLNSTANFSKEVKILARIDLNKQYYRLDLDGQALNLAELFSKIGRAGAPVSTDFPVKMHAEGLGLENWQLNIHEISAPCSFPLGGELCKIEGLADLKLTKYDQDYFLDLKKLVLADPALSLTGKISRRRVDQTAAPIWHIDLKGTDIDLSAVRKTVLSKFGSDQIAKEVCDIVRGGRAKSASYTFSGPAADFEHLRKMKIQVDVDKAPIHIPDLGLTLDWASGPITIVDGNLIGRGLSAQIGKSRGRDGNLLLSLPEDSNDFKLDLHIDADLNDLQLVLKKIIANQPFQQELLKFKNVSGQASGNLHLGDKLNDFKTKVAVQNIEAAGTYGRLPWPFKIKDGTLQVDPQRVSWDHIKGALGPHIIKQSRGEVSWAPRRKTRLNVSQFDADLNLADLWNKGSLLINGRKLLLKNHLAADLSDVSGQAEMVDSTLTGTVENPESWRFDTTVNAHNLKFRSPYLPGTPKSQNLQVQLNEKSASLTGIFKFLNRDLYINGNYRHHQFKKWQGSTMINGIIAGQLGQWLKRQPWIPARLFPRLPCELKDLTITNNNLSWTDTRIRGGIIAGKGSKTGPELRLDLIRTPKVSLNNISFLDGSRRGYLTYNTWKSYPAKTIFTWHGALQADTLAALFQQDFVDSGKISGSFNMLSSHKKDLSSSFNGYFTAQNVALTPLADSRSVPPLTIKNMNLSGEGHKIKISKTDILLGEDLLKGQGSITTKNKNYQVNLNLTANDLAWHNLRLAITTLKDRFRPETTTKKTAAAKANILPASLSGAINFDLGRFIYKKPPNQDERPGHETLYTWSPLLGALTFQDGANIKIKVTSGRVCGMNMSGGWDFSKQPESGFFEISQQSPPFLFEKTLPCLGVEQSLIEGPFSLDAKFSGRPGNWQSGHLNLKSPHGLIRRMDLLSKIFSVINFTDLLSWNDKSTSGHKGLEYHALDIKTKIKDNVMTVDKVVLKGKGVNLTGRGTVALKDDRQADLTFFIAPLKMLDTVVTHIPLVGKALGGKKESILTFPVGVKGPLKDPTVTALPPSAIGKATVEFIMDTLTLPFRIFAPLIPETKAPQKNTK